MLIAVSRFGTIDIEIAIDIDIAIEIEIRNRVLNPN